MLIRRLLLATPRLPEPCYSSIPHERPSVRHFCILHHRVLIFLVLLIFANTGRAQSDLPPTDTVLDVFQNSPNDGALPAGGVVFDSKGNLYGATTYGGNGGSDCIGGSCGTGYELSPAAEHSGPWTETILYNFRGVSVDNDGELPNGGLVIDDVGNLYGVTAYGGTGNCILFGGRDGCGTVYELSPPSQPAGAWTKTTIYSFQGGLDGYLPLGNLTFDQSGNLYGATQYGGGFGSCNEPFYQYCGTVFELSPPKSKGAQWTEKVLYSFKGVADGANPNGDLIFDKYGAIYGTTYYGGFVPTGSGMRCLYGATATGCGTVFRLEPAPSVLGAWKETALHRFHTTPDGGGPNGGLVTDLKGDLFGTTVAGGINEVGTVFQLTAPDKMGESWSEKIVVSFGAGTQSQLPMGGLVMNDGNLYGTAYEGGIYYAGAVFRLNGNEDWNYSLLSDFSPGNQAAGPQSSLTFGEDGALYGTTQGYDHLIKGAVFRVNP